MHEAIFSSMKEKSNKSETVSFLTASNSKLFLRVRVPAA